MEKEMRKTLLVVVSGWLAVSVQAALVWTGGGDGYSLFQEANWEDDSGNTPANDTINGRTAVTADTGTENLIEISSGTGSPNNAAQYFHVGANSLTISGGKYLNLRATPGTDPAHNDGALVAAWDTADLNLIVSGGAIVKAYDLRNFTEITVDASTLTLTDDITVSDTKDEGMSISNGSTVSASYINNFASVTVDGTSTLTLTHASDPLRSNIILAEGALLTLSDAAMFDTEAAQIFVDGVSYAHCSSILTIVGSTATAGAYDGPAFGSPFQDGMVLQRGKAINVWGTSDPSSTVTVSINGTSVDGVADANGDWMVCRR
jgi:hypothetical protein